MELHEAIKNIVSKFGIDILSDRMFINVLLDYYHFEVPAKKRIVTSLVEDGQLKRLENCGDVELEINNIANFELQTNGYHEDLTKEVLVEMAKGMGKTINTSSSIQKSDQQTNSAPASSTCFKESDIIETITIADLIKVESCLGSIVLSLSSHVSGDPAAWGDDLFMKQKYDLAFDAYKKCSGKTTCDLKLGLCYLYGLGTQQDFQKAEEKFKMFSDWDSLHMFCLGLLYEMKHTSDSDYIEAVKWYMKSSEKNYSLALTNLGICYYRGKGVAQDYKEAVKWFKKAVKHGNACAQAYLGACYLNGYGVRKNISEAIQLFIKSSDQHHLLGEFYLGQCYENGVGVVQSRDEAIRLYSASATQGNIVAKNRLAAII